MPTTLEIRVTGLEPATFCPPDRRAHQTAPHPDKKLEFAGIRYIVPLRCSTPAAPNLCRKNLLENLGDDASTDGATAFTNGKAHPLLDRDRSD